MRLRLKVRANRTAQVPAATSEPNPGISPLKLVCIIDDAIGTRDLSYKLAGLGYETMGLDCALPPEDCLAVIINVGVDVHLSLTSVLSKHHPVILISDDQTFEFYLAAVRAGARACLVAPVDLVELGAWLAGLSNGETRPYSILIVEDDEITAQTYSLVLEQAGMQTCVVTDVTLAPQEINRMAPDLILMDMNMPVASGLEVAQILRLSLKNLSVPIVFLSAETDTKRQQLARKVGGDDFISKPVNLGNLSSLVEIRAERARALRQIMDRDSLTGLLNHARFKDRVADELERSRRTGAKFSLCLLDLDHFKQVNDRHGHLCGDRVLRTLAQSLQGMLRRTDVIARYGGEEFAVLLLETDASRAQIVIDKIRLAFDMLEFEGPTGLFSVTLSAGVSDRISGASVESLIQQADEALYLAKDSGRNRVVVAPSR
jgi:diguanylate cyclase (GGDEF)-like protein